MDQAYAVSAPVGENKQNLYWFCPKLCHYSTSYGRGIGMDGVWSAGAIGGVFIGASSTPMALMEGTPG